MLFWSVCKGEGEKKRGGSVFFFSHVPLSLSPPPSLSFSLSPGLVDGRILWDINHAREYPLGDITYADWFNWLNCLDISYCYGWLNDDPTVRNAATQRADELNDQVKGEEMDGEGGENIIRTIMERDYSTFLFIHYFFL